jgi:mannose-6-phosphate isomerase-like protein (cupin superfamily)
MHVPERPDPGFPSPLALQRVVRCLGADIEATANTRDRVRASPARKDLSYLDRLIHKPWGSEFRVYEDEVTDVWSLHIRPMHRTSLHCHPNKRTALLCLEGTGTLSTCSGVAYALEPGVVLHIERGAYHRSTAGSGTSLRLIEVETPNDKFDLLRLEDDYRNPATPYEGERHAPLRLVERQATGDAVPLALQPLLDQRLAAYRWGRLRAQCLIGRYRFAVQTGEQIHASANLVFAIALEPRAGTPNEVTVLGPEGVVTATPETVYLTIRTR